jgi:hypothetical protein
MENDNYNQARSAEEIAAEEVAAEQAVAFASAMAAAETLVLEETAQPVVEAPAYQAPEEVQALGSVADGVIGASTAPKAPEKNKSLKAAKVKETVALYSTKNVSWSEVGKVYRGYNIVDKDAAAKWLTRSHIRTATPEEVAKEFGN